LERSLAVGKDGRITLADIAERLGVSVNTVSHALHDKPDISEALKKKIKAAASELGYIKNYQASLLRSGKSKTIAIIVGDISNPHFSIMIKEIEEKARCDGYTAFVLNTNEDEDIEKQAIVTALEKNVDGIILCPVQKSEQNVKFLISNGVPFTLIGRRFDKLDTSYVTLDDEEGGYLAARYIIERGNEKIAVISADRRISSAGERLAGIKRAFLQLGRALEDSDIYITSASADDDGVIPTVLNRPYDAAICFSDLIALKLLSAAKSPIDVVSFDNIRSRFAMPKSFASVTSSKAKMSHKAIEILLEKINGRQDNVKVILPTRLSEGDI
jgi:LacI family transcriptional regulator